MAIKDYSTSAGSNTALFPEGMNPGAVNDGMRQVQADIRADYEGREWRNLGFTPTYVSGTSFNLAGDKTAVFPVNSRLMLSGSVMATVYATVTTVAFAAGTTTVTIALDTGTIDNTLNAVSIGVVPTNTPVPVTSVSGISSFALTVLDDADAATARTTLGVDTAISSAISSAITPVTASIPLVGQCRLVKSGSNIVLLPYNGSKIPIAGTMYTVPAAGVSLTPSGLSAGTIYYIYAYMNSGTMTLEASTTVRQTDGSNGVEVKNGDGSRTLVGLVRPIAGPAFADSATQRFVLSWFNRLNVPLFLICAGATISSTTAVELNAADRVEFLTWSTESVQTGYSINGVSGSNTALRAQLILDGAAVGTTKTLGACPSSEAGCSNNVTLNTISEGYHYIGVNAWRGNANLTYDSGAITAMIRG